MWRNRARDKRPKKTRIGTLFAVTLAVALGAQLLTPTAASAAQDLFADPQGDVYVEQSDGSRQTVGGSPELDIVDTLVGANGGFISVGIQLTVAPLSSTTYGWELNSHGAGSSYLVAYRPGSGRPRIVAEGGTAAECASYNANVQATVLVVTIDRSCVPGLGDVITFDALTTGSSSSGQVVGDRLADTRDKQPFVNLSAPDAYNAYGPDGTIYRLYRAYFLRQPDIDGFSYWRDAYRNGYPLRAISNDFARSAEFQSRYGQVDNRTFVQLVYENVLERQPDAGGYQYWLDQMDRGLIRGDVMLYFSDSREYRGKTAAGIPPGF